MLPLSFAFLPLDSSHLPPIDDPNIVIPLYLRVDTLVHRSKTLTKSDISDFLEWEQDVLLYGYSWDLAALPRLRKLPLIQKLADIDPYRLARDNYYDIEVMSECVKKYGLLLACASKSLQDNKELVLHAINERPSAIEFASDSLKIDHDLIMACLTKDGLSLALFPESVSSQKEYAKVAVTQNGMALKYVKGSLNDDIELVEIACSKIGFALQFASVRLKKHERIVTKAILSEGNLEEWKETMQEDTPPSRQASNFMTIREMYQSHDRLFFERNQFIEFLTNPTMMPLDYADISLQNNTTLRDISAVTKRTLLEFGTSSRSRAVKRGRFEDVVGSAALPPLRRILPNALAPILKRQTGFEHVQEFIGPMPGIDLRELLGPQPSLKGISVGPVMRGGSEGGLEESKILLPPLPVFYPSSLVKSQPDISALISASLMGSSLEPSLMIQPITKPNPLADVVLLKFKDS